MGKIVKPGEKIREMKETYKFRVNKHPFSIEEVGKNICGAYFNIARQNFYRTLLHIFSSVGIDCYTSKNSLFVKEDTMASALEALQAIEKDKNTKEKVTQAIESLYQLVENCYDMEWELFCQKEYGGKISSINAELKKDLSEDLKNQLNTEKEKIEKEQQDKQEEFYKDIENEKNRLRQSFILKSEQEEKLRKLLFKHLPFLSPIMADVVAYNNSHAEGDTINNGVMKDVTLAECLQQLVTIAKCLNDCRDFYSHYNPYDSVEVQIEQFKRQNDLAIKLDKVFVASRRKVKERNQYTETQLEFLTGKLHYRNLEKKERDNNGGKNKIPEERRYYYYRIRGERKFKDVENFEDYKDKKSPAMSDFGIVFFCSLFLSKEYTTLMCNQLELFDHSPFTEEANNIVHNMLYVYRIHTPKGKRLDSENDENALGMDILNELRRCPMPLYEVLPPLGRKEFEDDVRHQNSRTEEISKRLRYVDRFPSLVLKYIDAQKLFSQIRFQVRLGSYRFSFYDKICIDGEPHLRILHKEINGFGRLQDMEKLRKSEYGAYFPKTRQDNVWQRDENAYVDLVQLVPNKAEDDPQLTNSIAQYNIHQNRIGLFWNQEGNSILVDKKGEDEKPLYEGYYLPPLSVVKQTTSEPEKDKNKALVEMPAPLCSLSVYDLPGLILYQHLVATQQGCESVDDVIIHKYQKMVSFFNDIIEGKLQPQDSVAELDKKLKDYYDLSKASVPKKVYRILSSQEFNREEDLKAFALNALTRRLRNAIRRKTRFSEDLAKIGQKDNKYGKKNFVDVRHGALGQYLAESILDWQVTFDGGKDKLTGLNYRVLASCLAKFGDGNTNLNYIKTILRKAKILANEGEKIANEHPFISKALDNYPDNIEDFYLDYLDAEIEYIKKYVDIEESGQEITKVTLKSDADLSKLNFVHSERKRWVKSAAEDLKELAARYLYVEDRNVNGEVVTHRATLLLPDGLFASPIVEVLKKRYEKDDPIMAALNNENLNHNVDYLVKLVFEKENAGDTSQPYYNSNFEVLPVYNSNTVPDFLRENPGNNKYVRGYELFKAIHGKPIFYSSDEIQVFLSKKITDRNTESPLKIVNRQGEECCKREIHAKIDANVEGVRTKGDFDSLEEARNARRRKLEILLKECKESEKTIRRYKAQDMILFLMAKNLLSNAIGESDKFKLSKVCDDDFLDQKINAHITLHLDDYTVKIQKEEMPIKNYGQLFRLLSDNRVMTILSYPSINEATLEYDDLIEELSIYDERRTSVFDVAQKLERASFVQHKEELTNPENDLFYCHNKRYRVNSGRENQPKRNNFEAMLKLLLKMTPQQQSMFSKVEQDFIKNIRNSFGHNGYPIRNTIERIANGNDPKFADLKEMQLKGIASLFAGKLLDCLNDNNIE
jgi:hypothetical protein